jgi:hypothetical protein
MLSDFAPPHPTFLSYPSAEPVDFAALGSMASLLLNSITPGLGMPGAEAGGPHRDEAVERSAADARKNATALRSER